MLTDDFQSAVHRHHFDVNHRRKQIRSEPSDFSFPSQYLDHVYSMRISTLKPAIIPIIVMYTLLMIMKFHWVK